MFKNKNCAQHNTNEVQVCMSKSLNIIIPWPVLD